MYANPEISGSEAFKRIRVAIMEKYESGKIKDSHVKKFLANYYDGSPHDMLKGSNKKALLEDFILINEALVGDDLKEHTFKQLYIRHGMKHCCGQLVATLPNNNPYCEVCGTEYK